MKHLPNGDTNGKTDTHRKTTSETDTDTDADTHTRARAGKLQCVPRMVASLACHSQECLNVRTGSVASSCHRDSEQPPTDSSRLGKKGDRYNRVAHRHTRTHTHTHAQGENEKKKTCFVC